MASGQVSYFVALALETIPRPYPPDVTELGWSSHREQPRMARRVR